MRTLVFNGNVHSNKGRFHREMVVPGWETLRSSAATTIEKIRADLDAERSTEGFAKKKVGDARRREKAQAEYAEDFFGAVVNFLDFIRSTPILLDA